jgi:hypothetical protein
MLTMPPTTTTPRLRQWVERGLKENGHPSLATIVTRARRARPPIAWASIAADITTRSGESVSYETLRQWFTEADATEAGQ